MKNESTIAAISTPYGRGGIAVIRLSGPEAFGITEQIFNSKKFSKRQTHRSCHGWINEEGESIDEVMATYFQAPHSYTGEDVVEISCHGGIFISRRILELIIRLGAHPAKPGEFTERAYLNNRMDLAQAEAVADLIHARTEASRRVAAYQLEGRLSGRFQSIREALIHVCSLLELELDFSEEDVEFTSRDDLETLLVKSIGNLEKILSTYKRGKVCREGIRLAIVGRPNVGKSSLLNALIEKERAIVTDQPGTTRDTIEELLDIEGVLFTITDTAGIRNTDDPVEKEGVERSRKAIASADLILLVLDGSEPLSDDDGTLIHTLKKDNKPCFIVINKSDLPLKVNTEDVQHFIDNPEIRMLSSKTGEGLDVLIESLESFALGGDLPHEGDIILTRERHQISVTKAIDFLLKAKESLQNKMSQEFMAVDLRGALDTLGEITGETTTDDILNHIFSGFCIGK